MTKKGWQPKHPAKPHPPPAPEEPRITKGSSSTAPAPVNVPQRSEHLTVEEVDALDALAHAAKALLALPEIHPDDRQETASRLHDLQRAIFMRPAYRTYCRDTWDLPHHPDVVDAPSTLEET